MSCAKAPNPTANHALPSQTNLERAIQNLHDADFLGLTDFYHESICMLRFRRSRKLPSECMCSNITNGQAQHVHETHGVPENYSQGTISQHVQQMVDALTSLDRTLFGIALDRFATDIEEVEGMAGNTILCERQRISQLRKDLDMRP
jgi:hypothetical protein